jgi:hypothetical protein
VIAGLLFAAFTFAAVPDPFTDAVTYVAQSGSDRGPMVAIKCGAATNGELSVVVKSDRPMYRPVIPLVGTYPQRVRFDDRPVATYGFHYDGDAAVLLGTDASAFVAEAKTASVVLLEVDEIGDKVAQLRIPLAGAADSIARVEQSCRT